jgi:hypothetical protein
VPRAESGFFVPGQTRDIARVHTAHGDVYVVARNNDRPLIFRNNGATGGTVASGGKPSVISRERTECCSAPGGGARQSPLPARH